MLIQHLRGIAHCLHVFREHAPSTSSTLRWKMLSGSGCVGGKGDNKGGSDKTDDAYEIEALGLVECIYKSLIAAPVRHRFA